MGIVGFWLPWAGVPFQSLVGVDDDSFKKKKKLVVVIRFTYLKYVLGTGFSKSFSLAYR